MEDKACVNTDVVLWRRTPGDFYAPSIHVTESGLIGINVGGQVFVKSVEEWHRLAIAAAIPGRPFLTDQTPSISQFASKADYDAALDKQAMEHSEGGQHD